jgi:hypothetical protein
MTMEFFFEAASSRLLQEALAEVEDKSDDEDKTARESWYVTSFQFVSQPQWIILIICFVSGKGSMSR